MTALDDYLRSRPDRCDSCGWQPATQGHGVTCAEAGDDWATFVAALRQVAGPDRLIHQHKMRPLIRSIFHKKRGQFYVKARTEGLIEIVGEEPSKDFAGGNGDKKSRVYRLRNAA